MRRALEIGIEEVACMKLQLHATLGTCTELGLQMHWQAAERSKMKLDHLLQVDGVFDCDPETHPEAKLHRELTYRDVIAHNLRVMDETAITICKENNIPVRVFNIARPGNIMRALAGDSTVGTIVSEACPDLPSRTLPEAEIS